VAQGLFFYLLDYSLVLWMFIGSLINDRAKQEDQTIRPPPPAPSSSSPPSPAPPWLRCVMCVVRR